MCLAQPDSLKLAEGAEDFLSFLKQNNIPRTIATMSEWQNVEFYIDVFKLEKWFDLTKIVYSNGIIKGKPDPEIYTIASDKIKISPENCIVIEDALSGIQSAKDANIGTIIAIASLESHDLYKPINYLYQIINDFNDIDRDKLFFSSCV